jgi:hypothetical protein
MSRTDPEVAVLGLTTLFALAAVFILSLWLAG